MMELFTLDAVLNLESEAFMEGVSLARDAMQGLMDIAVDIADSSLGFDSATAGVEAILKPLEDVGEMLIQVSGSAAEALESQLSDAGARAAESVADSLMSALNGLGVSLDISARTTGGGRVQRNAGAMNSGRIFNNPTIFAYADGAYQMAGDAGAEAVVGVDSLRSMIMESVRIAELAAQQARAASAAPQVANIVLELDRRVVAQGVYQLNREETQRVGVSFSNAGI